MLPKYGPLAASPRQRFHAYIPHLEAAGIEVATSELFSNAYLESYFERGQRSLREVLGGYLRRLSDLTRAGDQDCLMIHFELLPYLPALFERPWVGGRTPVVLDFDDAIHHQYDRHGNALARVMLGGKIPSLVRAANAVTAGNEYLADFARSAGCPRVHVLPTAIDTPRYAEAVDTTVTDQDRPVTIGWMGSRSTGKYLDAVYPVIARLARKYPLRLLLVGFEPGRELGFPVEARSWSEEREISDLGEMDIGIMPLPDTPWERGKCGYKLIQYMGASRPVVASPVGVNASIVEDGINGLLAGTEDEWYAALKSLIEQPQRRAEMGRAGRARVAREYSIDANAPKLIDILQEVAAR